MRIFKLFRRTKRKCLLLLGTVSMIGCLSSSIGELDLSAISNSIKEQVSEYDTYTYELNTDTDSLESAELEILNNNIPLFTETEKQIIEPFESYSPLDALGRCGTAYANICKEILPTEERGEIGHIKPTGWHTVKYDCIDGKYLYNRCHLIAFCLAGENDNPLNLITGTRYFNTELMLPYELQVAKYLDQNPNNHVLYRVTPIFTEDNLIADGVQMEAWSVEDNGSGICFNVYVSNVQPNIIINYQTGESKEI